MEQECSSDTDSPWEVHICKGTFILMYSLCGEIGLYYFPIDLFDKKVEIAKCYSLEWPFRKVCISLFGK